MKPHEQILNLVNSTLKEMESGAVLSDCIRKAIRIARLRYDYVNLLWLEKEMVSAEDKWAKDRFIKEILPHFTKEQFESLKARNLEEYLEERRIPVENDEEKICSLGVEEIEAQIQHLIQIHDSAEVPPGMHSLDVYFLDQSNKSVRAQVENSIAEFKKILARIRQRVSDFLSVAEQQLIYGQVNADIFEQNREYVDRRLATICPGALEMFESAMERVAKGKAEARSHALTSCRRILKALADKLYPARDEPVQGVDGKVRRLTDDKYVSRLHQFVAEHCHSTKSGQLLLANLSGSGKRIDALYEMTCKGVHDQIDEFEMNQCVIQTYLLVGDILRVHESESAILQEE